MQVTRKHSEGVLAATHACCASTHVPVFSDPLFVLQDVVHMDIHGACFEGKGLPSS